MSHRVCEGVFIEEREAKAEVTAAGSKALCTEFLTPEAYGRMHAGRGEIWQMRLLDARRLMQFARQRGAALGGFSGDSVERLWLLGMLRADLVRVDPHVDKDTLLSAAGEGLIEVGTDEGHRLYADGRGLAGPRVGAAAKLKGAPKGIKPLFHPFRYHVLHWLFGLLQLDITPLSVLTTAGPESYASLAKQILGWKDEHFSSPEFAEDVRRINDRTTLAAVTDPLYYGRLFGERRVRTDYEPEELGLTWEEYHGLETEERRQRSRELFDRHVEEHRREVFPLYREARLERVEEARKRLCQVSETLDPNRNMQNLIRVTRGSDRLELKGATGGAALLRTMAELLRRAAEDIFPEKLPEEDEMGSVIRRPGWKKEIYGGDRLLDGDKSVTREFIRRYGLDVGARVRWYMEGETEYWALAAVFGTNAEEGVVLVNLRAHFVEKRILAFRDSLRSDIDQGIYSFVSLDPDDKDRLRAVRRAVEDDEFFGCFFITDPDFEFHNFTARELGEILWHEAKSNGAPDGAKEILLNAVDGATTAKELFKRVWEALPGYLDRAGKGEEWGHRLMDYAMQHPEKADGEMRPVVDAVDLAASSHRTSYHASRSSRRVDPETGRLVPKGETRF